MAEKSANRRVRKQTLRLNADTVVHRSADPLFTTEVPLCGLNRHVSEKELDLLQFAIAGAKCPNLATSDRF